MHIVFLFVRKYIEIHESKEEYSWTDGLLKKETDPCDIAAKAARPDLFESHKPTVETDAD